MARRERYLFGACLTLLVLAQSTYAQNVFRVRVDTVHANAGDTVVLNVYQAFTSTHPHNIDRFTARLFYDTNEVRIVDILRAGTASEALTLFDFAHYPVASLTGQTNGEEIDVGNPVLFRIRIAVLKQTADTALFRWDSSYPLLDPTANVDSVIQTNGWVLTPSIMGHAVLAAPAMSVRGQSDGFILDSVAFDLPIVLSAVPTQSKLRRAAFNFRYPLRFPFSGSGLRFIGASNAGRDDTIVSVDSMISTQGDFATARVVVNGSGAQMLGGDTVVVLHFLELIGIDSVCGSLDEFAWQRLNPDAIVGNTEFQFGPICSIGSRIKLDQIVRSDVSDAQRTLFYPNPARDAISIAEGDRDQTIEIFDQLGRCVFKELRAAGIVRFELPSGSYEVTVRANGTVRRTRMAVLP